MKKRILAVIAVFTLLITSLTPVYAADYILGDVDGNKNITAADARLALRASVNLEKLSINEMLAADVNKDGFITAADARLILRASVGLEYFDDSTYKKIIFGTGGVTGTYFAFANAVTQAISIKPYEINVISTGGSQANIEAIDDGDYNMAIVQNDVMNYAYNGTIGFETPIKSFSAIASIYPEVCQIVTTKNSGIKTVSDLKGKKVAIGDAGSTVFYNALQILTVAGIDYRSDIKAIYAPFGESATALKDGYIDAAFITSGTPTFAVSELSSSIDIVFVNLNDSLIDTIIDTNTFYIKYTLTSADYPFIDTPVNTIATKNAIIAANNMSEELVYRFTKSLWEDPDVPTCHNKAAQMNIKTTLVGMGDVPLHPGALRYYKEKGIITS